MRGRERRLHAVVEPNEARRDRDAAKQEGIRYRLRAQRSMDGPQDPKKLGHGNTSTRLQGRPSVCVNAEVVLGASRCRAHRARRG
jgi:hypothetical protein